MPCKISLGPRMLSDFRILANHHRVGKRVELHRLRVDPPKVTCMTASLCADCSSRKVCAQRHSALDARRRRQERDGLVGPEYSVAQLGSHFARGRAAQDYVTQEDSKCSHEVKRIGRCDGGRSEQPCQECTDTMRGDESCRSKSRSRSQEERRGHRGDAGSVTNDVHENQQRVVLHGWSGTLGQKPRPSSAA